MEAASGKVCAALQAICIQCTGSIPDHLFIMVHGPVDNAGPADRKKPGFIIEILLKAFVLLWSDMVRGNIGKQAEIKADAARWSIMAWEETSMTIWVQPASTIFAKYSCTR